MSGPPNAGELRDRIRIDRRGQAADDGAGNTERAWAVLIAERPAKMAPLRGGEVIIAARAQGTSTFDIWVYFDAETATIQAQDRLIDLNDPANADPDNPGVTFNIAWAEDWDRRRRFIRIQAEKGVADG